MADFVMSGNTFFPTYFEPIDMKNRSITVHGADVTITTRHDQDYISLTDMVKRFGDESILYGWLRNRNTIEFLGIWEQIYNPAFKPIEFERFKSQAGLNSFSLSPKKWVEATGAIGLYAKAGRGGGTYAHKDIAFDSAPGSAPSSSYTSSRNSSASRTKKRAPRR
ncbi:MAG TPA: KilA-N domain-containing protein [Herbaspirillum sp.]|nr:KilA-N domain-containing protein [Herbaspirillum sp.]